METVELRVHGVHGTSPGAMLGVADGEVGQVAGDGLTGIYRAKQGVTLPYRDLALTSVSVEAYSWGALTSGVQGVLGWLRRVLWLFLLPFALVNLAYWARLELGKDTGQARWGARAVRVSGLLLTVFFVLTPCVLAIDLGAWQCYRYGVPGCARIPGQLDFLAGWQPGQRLAFATLAPMAVIALLWWLSRGTLSRYESTEDPSDAPPDLPSRPILLHPDLWNGTARTRRLQRLHLVAAVATVVAFSGLHELSATSLRPDRLGAVPLWGTVVLSLLLLVVAVLLTTVTHAHDVEPLVGSGWARALGDWARGLEGRHQQLLAFSLVVYGLHLVALSTVHLAARTDESLNFAGRNVWFIVLFVLLTMLHISVFAGGRMHWIPAVALVTAFGAAPVVLWWLYHRPRFLDSPGPVVVISSLVALVLWGVLARWQYAASHQQHPETAWRGAGASVLLAAATWIALLFTTGAVIATANYLNGPDHGVGDLVSRVHAPTATQARQRVGLPREDSRARTTRFAATGDVTLTRARVIVSGSTAEVVSGAISMKDLTSVSVKGQRVPGGKVSERVGATPVTETVELTVPAGVLSLRDSCVADADTPCTAEDPAFRAGGALALAQDGSEDPVTLTVDPGVWLRPTDAPTAALAVPQVLIWTPIGQVVWLLVVIALIAGCVVRFSVGAGRELAENWSDGSASWVEEIAGRDRPRCRSARRTAALAHRAERLLDLVGAATSLVALVVITASISGVPPWALPYAGFLRTLATTSMWVVVGMSVGLVGLGSQIRRSERTRKAVGVIWDLTTFWPRAAHPLAPPCYAERVVPELQIRTRWALEHPTPTLGPPNQVILSGHSQGSLIVLATASRLRPEQLARVRMITYGSQIRALYGRVFPRVFGPEAIGYAPTYGTPTLGSPYPDVPDPAGAPGPPAGPGAQTFRGRLDSAGGEWVNLFRRTDPLGWRVFSDVDSVLDLPVPEVPDQDLGDPGPHVKGHGGYQHTRVYREQVRRWTRERLVQDPPGTRDVPSLPSI